MGLRAKFPFLTTIALVAIIITSAVLGHLIIQRVLNPAFSPIPHPDNPELARRGDYVLAYQCEISICVSRGDGSGQRKLNDSLKDREQRTNPSMNEFGRIAFECQWVSKTGGFGALGNLWRICTINADGTGLEILSPARSNTSPQINNSGQIAFICAERICMFNQNPNEPTAVTELDRDGAARDPDINDAGQVVFVCEKGPIQNICLVDSINNRVINLTNFETQQVFARPKINDAGVIIYECHDQDLVGAVNICLIHADGSGARTLTRAESLQKFMYPDINERGQIVLQCNINGQHICSVNQDGTNLRQLTPPGDLESANNSFPSISNSGIVAFYCAGSICIMRSDGSDIRAIGETSGNQLGGQIEVY